VPTMLKKLPLFIVFAAALVLAGCKSKEQVEAEQAAIKAEQEKLQGKWKFASRIGDNEDEDDKDAKDDKDDKDAKKPDATGFDGYVVDGDILKDVWIDKDGKETVFVRYKMTIIPGKEPKQVDLAEVDEAGKPVTETKRTKSRGKTKTSKSAVKRMAIYKIDGDKLTLCISFGDKRPADFDPKKGSFAYAVTLEKAK
jgi:uncharacterized protein (TIGR03067 family)